jgi:hypothetical protein
MQPPLNLKQLVNLSNKCANCLSVPESSLKVSIKSTHIDKFRASCGTKCGLRGGIALAISDELELERLSQSEKLPENQLCYSEVRTLLHRFGLSLS